ncbi:membrane protein [Bradyrhizobium sp. LTSPM299]|uniref:outer membrane protein n=1 Tax=Bradyrhizobium sp. LTSPM299 TaxID=1619233 RepID=UPI0005CABC77|nr:outer membrane beta-barrel protein [Bradyrhizobium sp. LTSPM299]KJC56348.1 membrane protein [Bradyrhizobium sp. LTSPM299]
MKKLVLALTAVATFTGSALAADLSAAPSYAKAPPVVALPSWTGFYIFGGGGGGIWDANTGLTENATGGCILCVNNKQGGDGWFGSVGAGYDWQVNSSWIIGILVDGQFGSIKGSISEGILVGNEKVKESWAAGARVGYLVGPNVLSYVNAGYTGSKWDGTTLLSGFTGNPSGFHTGGFTAEGWFIGGGVENNLNIFGITAPGWFMKTEYRAAYYGNKSLNALVDGTNVPAGLSVNFNDSLVQTVSTSLVYRFNVPAVAKY